MKRGLAVLTVLAALSVGHAGSSGGRPPLAPNFAITELEGQHLRLQDFRGQLVIVLFGDAHCAVCRENDRLLRLYQYQYADRGLIVVSLHEHVASRN